MRWADTMQGARLGVIVAIALSLASPAAAQGRSRGPGGGGSGGGAASSKAEDFRETFTILMMVRMKNELDLSKEQYEQILPKIEELEKQRYAGSQSRRAMGMRLKGLLAQSATPDSEFQEIVEKLSALDDGDRKRDQAFFTDVRKLLNPRQQAQFLLFRQKFRDWLGDRMTQMKEMRQMRRGGLGRPGAARGLGPDDDEEGERDAPGESRIPPR